MKRSLVLCLSFVLCLILTNCKTGSKKQSSIAVAYSEYISSYTSGAISITDNIKVNLNAAPEVDHAEQLSSDLIQLEPSVTGKTVLTDGHTLVFQPEKPLKSGQSYNVTFQLGKLMTVPEALKKFSFQVRTIDADFSVELSGIRSFRTNGEVKMEIKGTVITSDAFPAENVEKMVKSEQKGAALPVKWMHSGGNATVHEFSITDVKRENNPGKVSVNWNG
jgi:hypothetical protein